MNPLQIVIISYNIYPVLSPRSFRTTELAKELVKKGHKVTLYAKLIRDYDYTSFVETTGIILKNIGKFHENSFFFTNIVGKIIRRLTEYPRIKLIPYIKAAIKAEENIDYLISIAMPHTIHWGVGFSNLNRVQCWTADCGDPYMGNPYAAFHPFYFKWIEKKWCKKANFITIPIEEAKDGYYTEFRDKIHVIPQGFDFSNITLSNYKKNSVPTFAYSGVCYVPGRDITTFLEYLCSLKCNFRFIVYTKSTDLFMPFIERLGEKLILKDYVPREILLEELSKMDFLINIKNDFEIQQPSKLIDYYITKRPILEITSLFKETNTFDEFLNGNYVNKLTEKDISNYEISNVANKFIELYNKKIFKNI